MKRIAIIGAGTWGTGLAIIAARAGHEVRLWCRSNEVAASINSRRANPRYLSFAHIPDGVVATTQLEMAIDGIELLVLVAPSQALRGLLVDMRSFLTEEMIIVSASKGLEISSGKRISEVVTETVGNRFVPRFVCLSGPSFAREVVQRHPTAVVAASRDLDAARTVQQALSFENLRLYTNSDVVGTELGGSVKNVMAIAAGMTFGLGFGSNSIAALITRGLAEISRLALHEGAQPKTLMGLAGLGDLVLTCTGSLSRNRFVGERLGKGQTLAAITSEMKEVAEGVETTLAVKLLADRAGLELPITNEVKAVLYEGKSPREAVAELMRRPLKEEGD